MVQFVNIREVKIHLSQFIVRAGKGDVVITSRGKPQAVLHKVTSEDLEDYLLAHSKKFLKSLSASYREYKQKGGTSLNKLIKQVERPVARVHR